MVNVVVVLEIDPARTEEFLRIMKSNAEASRQEAGCTGFSLNGNFKEDNWFALSESYVDEAALQAHTETPHYAEWREAVQTGIVLNRWAVKGPVLG